MIVLDIEASGVNQWKNSILSIGAIDFNDTTREFYAECQIREGASIDSEAMAVCGFSEAEVRDPSKKTEKEIVLDFFAWVGKSNDHTIAGQNPFFDLFYLQYASWLYHVNFPLAHRTIDLHSICFYHMNRRNIPLPLENHRTSLNSDTIMAYVGIPAEPKPHNALRGAKWEAEAFMRLLKDRGVYPDFDTFKIPWLNHKS